MAKKLDKSEKLIESVLKAERRAIARCLSIVENNLSEKDAPLSETITSSLFPLGGKAKIFGITGAPGAGKSTLIDSLISSFLEAGLRIAILAIDPSSPFSGGALLGDRARMYSDALNDRLFIRSSASRGQLGGLSPRTPELLHILDAAGFDIIIVETVGVGQAELDIMKCSDIVTVVMSPHTGDSLQALKAGIIEIADIFALNKSDLPGINDLEKDLILALSLAPQGKRRPELIKTTALKKEGADTLKKQLLKIYSEFDDSGELTSRREKALEFQLHLSIRELFSRRLFSDENLKKEIRLVLAEIFDRKKSPREAAGDLLEKIR